ncbi:MAG TPA: nicotinate phosphoribosyltransferase [Blastocatellia bacterium]|nr:nicotinate phosphoribosyltransferase [Blastocatellia bacterium]
MIERPFGLTTDLYELTMAAAYFESGLQNKRATFDLFVRSLPPQRSYLIVAGLEQALDYLANLRFTSGEIEYLREHPSFNRVSREFFDYLGEFRFSGDVWAMPEGAVAFGMEPLLRVTGPIIEAQVIETFLLATINHQTMIASKAARVVGAAAGRAVIEFGTRRAHGAEAGLFGARAAYIGGCAGTSNVEAGHRFGIPTFGTLAHSFIMSFDEEDEAFRAFLRVFPETATVLVDTYDTIAAVKRLAREFGTTIPAVRLDSGDLCELSKKVRQILNESGMSETKIFASGDLNERAIADLIGGGAEIDSFGVGTQLATSYDSPALSGVYKLAALEEHGQISMRIKLSHDKATYPGPKQVWRRADDGGGFVEDVISLADEAAPHTGGEGAWRALLQPVMTGGRALADFAPVAPGFGVEGSDGTTREQRRAYLDRARTRALSEMKSLPDELLALDCTEPYPVRISARLTAERDALSGKSR